MSRGHAKFKCPSCLNRAAVDIKGGGWYWAKHTDKDGKPCPLSGKRMA